MIESMTESEMIDLAISRKRNFPTLHSICSDGNLRKSINTKHESDLRTLQSCLVNYDSEISQPWLKSLEDNLKVLKDCGAIKKPGQASSKLLSVGDFQNTLAELGLARTFLDKGWKVELEKPFGTKGKDADIFIENDREHCYVEVINVAPKKPEEDILYGSVSPLSPMDKLVEKITEKYRGKFESDLNNGWSGKAWIAIDYTKNDLENIAAFSRDLFNQPWWIDAVSHIRQECSKLTGVIAFRYMPNNLCADSVNILLL